MTMMERLLSARCGAEEEEEGPCVPFFHFTPTPPPSIHLPRFLFVLISTAHKSHDDSGDRIVLISPPCLYSASPPSLLDSGTGNAPRKPLGRGEARRRVNSLAIGSTWRKTEWISTNLVAERDTAVVGHSLTDSCPLSEAPGTRPATDSRSGR